MALLEMSHLLKPTCSPWLASAAPHQVTSLLSGFLR